MVLLHSIVCCVVGVFVMQSKVTLTFRKAELKNISKIQERKRDRDPQGPSLNPPMKVPYRLLISSRGSNRQFSTRYNCLKNCLYYCISHYLLRNYVIEYSFSKFIQTSPQIVDFPRFLLHCNQSTHIFHIGQVT